MGSSGKTPISLLQEFCVKRSITPVYDLIANEGPVHEPLFVFQCRAGAFQGVGRGVSKKRAKHNAAHATLLKMLNNGAALTEPECATIAQMCQEASAATASTDGVDADGGGFEDGAPSAVAASEAATAAAYLANFEEDDDDDTAGNPVGELQELCQRRLWPQATFHFAYAAAGPASAAGPGRQFACTAVLWRWEQQTCARSKRLAKRKAAQALLERIRTEKLTIPQEELDLLEESQIPVGQGEARPASPTRLSASAGAEIARLYSGLRVRKGGPQLPRVPASPHEAGECPRVRLEALTAEHRVALEFHDLAPGLSGAALCLLRLGTAPPLAAPGAGETPEAARIDACRAALDCLAALTDPRGRPV